MSSSCVCDMLYLVIAPAAIERRAPGNSRVKPPPFDSHAHSLCAAFPLIPHVCLLSAEPHGRLGNGHPQDDDAQHSHKLEGVCIPILSQFQFGLLLL